MLRVKIDTTINSDSDKEKIAIIDQSLIYNFVKYVEDYYS